MEDRDEISDNEISRLEALEQKVRQFELVTAGDGKVLGGFGKLPTDQDLLHPVERLQNIKNATNNFSFVGENVSISGNFDDGYVFS